MGEDMIEEMFDNKEDSSALQIDTDEHGTNDGNIGIHPCSSAVQIEKLRAEIDIKTKKGISVRALKWFAVSWNRKDSLVDLHGLEPCWLTHEWRAV